MKPTMQDIADSLLKVFLIISIGTAGAFLMACLVAGMRGAM
jgi:hypothetical protein